MTPPSACDTSKPEHNGLQPFGDTMRVPGAHVHMHVDGSKPRPQDVAASCRAFHSCSSVLATLSIERNMIVILAIIAGRDCEEKRHLLANPGIAAHLHSMFTMVPTTLPAKA